MSSKQIDLAELKSAIATAIANCKDSYAQSYLHATDEALRDYGYKGLHVQLLYCLSNMQYWRGETARRTKAVFKKYIKLLKKA